MSNIPPDQTPFPPEFFVRGDESEDAGFYAFPRYVTHIDDGAIAAVGALYDELGVAGAVLDLMSSWVSHFKESPASLTVLGMNADELAANLQARSFVVHDLNADPTLPFADDTFDHVFISHVITVVSDPYMLIREAQRVCKPNARIVIVNHFQSTNRLIALVEKWLCPLCTKLGWRSDLPLNDLVKRTGVQVDYRYKLESIDLWETVVISNNKSALGMALPILAV